MNSIYYEGDPPTSGIPDDLSQGNGQEELDFRHLFLYNPPGNDEDEQGDTSLTASSPVCAGGDPHAQDAQDTLSPEACLQENHTPYSLESLCDSPYHAGGASTTDGLSSSEAHDDLGEFLEHSHPLRPGGPRIEITYSELHPHDHPHTEPLDIGPRPCLTVPGYCDSSIYRGDVQCLSPASSNSSTSWSEACSPWTSPCVSPTAIPELCPRLQGLHTAGSPRTSPTTSPRNSITEDTFLAGRRSSSPHPGSRSASPKGKRTYDQYQNPSRVAPRSRSPSPHPDERFDPSGSKSGPAGAAGGGPGCFDELELVSSLSGSLPKPVPTKMVRPSFGSVVYQESQSDGSLHYQHEVKTEPAVSLETFYVIPSAWPGQMAHGVCSAPVTSLPSLEWPLRSSTEQLELLMEVQPKSYHRAHYETEGSRGAVKAPTGGHPVVQLRGYCGHEPLALQVFIGTSEERTLKPHAFYQVHRITGKTVTTSSQERIINGIKILEIPLDPKDNMRAVIDCAGILKLRNADIELRTGETDIGRKNTRVRLAFRVHVPQPGGQWVSLQVASQIIECSQRSAHELPAVERQDADHCSVLGGQQMILTGQNFTSDSKVVFSEKTHDGLQIWEAEATVDRDKSQASMLFVEIPPYRDHTIYYPAKVNFYVLNGRRKRSQPQHFTYTPLTVPFIKTEPVDDFQFGQLGCAVSQILGVSPSSRHTHPVPSQMPLDGCEVPSLPSHHLHQQPVIHNAYATLDPEYQLQCPPVVYRQARSLGSSPVMYQPILGSYPGRMTSMPAQHSPGSGTNHIGIAGYGARAVSASVLAEHHRVVMSNSFQEAASRFPEASGVPSVQPSGYGQMARQSHGHHHHQGYPPPAGQPSGAMPGRVTVKQEFLDHLDDVNDIIRNDMTALEREYT
ncbi:nuclear factor of activated T-cells, cytoplasmic 2 isoform X2 [Clupea harengus]|uniref:Nuclear factor of activated T-cells, cytoplasmic 2 isoform X2 n=1 Tax=Clupea harengus TaxID=7950 RepID=A0A6P8FJ51_CLUHA|nr:nuclear factor of activated T-cells, cytoplasmic 2 isoform X2 [Clupea harengus]